MFPLLVLSETLTITSNGQGASESAAISSAKLQATVDAESAGFLRRDGYQISAIRLIDLTKEGQTYFARIGADLTRTVEPKRILFLISAKGHQSTRITDLIRRLSESNLFSKQAIIEIVDTSALDSLRNLRPLDLQQLNANAELMQLLKNRDANLLYLVSSSSDIAPVFLVSVFENVEKSRIMRTLRGDESLYKLITDAVIQDIDQLNDAPGGGYLVSIPNSGMKVRKGQTVVIYADKAEMNQSRRTLVLTYGVVIETYGSNVRILAEHPVISLPNTKLRLGISKNRKTVINETDW
jgi:hypothetical protein